MRYVGESQLSFSQISCLSPLAAGCATGAQRKEQMPRIEFQFWENEKLQIEIQIQTREKSECREDGNWISMYGENEQRTTTGVRRPHQSWIWAEYHFLEKGICGDTVQTHSQVFTVFDYISSLEHALFSFENTIWSTW